MVTVSVLVVYLSRKVLVVASCIIMCMLLEYPLCSVTYNAQPLRTVYARPCLRVTRPAGVLQEAPGPLPLAEMWGAINRTVELDLLH